MVSTLGSYDKVFYKNCILLLSEELIYVRCTGKCRSCIIGLVLKLQELKWLSEFLELLADSFQNHYGR